MFKDILTYVVENQEAFSQALIEHILLSFLSVFIAFIIGLLLGIFCVKYKKVSNTIIGIFTFLRLIPSIAFLILFMPILKTGFLPAVVALTILAIPPICINTYSGIMGVDPFLIESATGMGLNKKQIFYRLELPLSIPMVIVGLRTSLIDVIATATVASIMGAGGLGRYIFAGMQMNNFVLLLLGGGTVALIALFVETSLTIVQKRFNRFI